LGAILHHVGLIDEVERELERALLISPDHVLAREHQGLCLYTRGRYREALEIFQTAARKAPSSWIQYLVALCELRLGQLAAAATTVDLMVRQVPGEVLAHPVRGLIAALCLDPVEARREVLLTIQKKRSFGHFHHAQYDLACIHALIGDVNEALAWLHEAARNGFPCGPQFESDSFLTPLRKDARFASLLANLREQRAEFSRLYAGLHAP